MKKIFRLFAEVIYKKLFFGHVEFQLQKHFTATPHYFGGDAGKVSIASSAIILNAFFNLSSGSVTIEEDVMFGNNVSILTGRHDPDQILEKRKLWPSEGGDIVIKKGAWIASNSTILGPCIIHEHAVVAAGSIVTRDVAAYTIVAGNPANVIRKVGEKAATI